MIKAPLDPPPTPSVCILHNLDWIAFYDDIPQLN